MDCWICGAPTDTGEHMIKASDIRDLFWPTTKATVVFRRVNNGPREIVQGANSAKLKFKTRLCANCNNARTQPHDKSWESLASYLRKRSPLIQPGEVVRPVHAFKGGLRPGLLGVHLYFVKLLGCYIHESNVPIDTQSLAKAICQNEPHPHVYLSFLVVKNKRLRNYAWVTPVETVVINGMLSGAQWFYFVGRIGVHVTYAPAIQTRSDKVCLWHPSNSKKTITFEGI